MELKIYLKNVILYILLLLLSHKCFDLYVLYLIYLPIIDLNMYN